MARPPGVRLLAATGAPASRAKASSGWHSRTRSWSAGVTARSISAIFGSRNQACLANPEPSALPQAFASG